MIEAEVVCRQLGFAGKLKMNLVLLKGHIVCLLLHAICIVHVIQVVITKLLF